MACIISVARISLVAILIFNSFTVVNSQEAPCPLPALPSNVTCSEPDNPGTYYVKNLVKDFGADPTGKTNSHSAFACAARFFNLNGGHGKLIIPYGTYTVGLQTFIEANQNTCPHWSDYGWIGMDLLHLADCSDLQITGETVNGKKPVIQYANGIKLGGFKKNGQPSNYVDNPDGLRYNTPANCTESEKNDSYQACAGTTFYIDNCSGITISFLEIDGNSAQYTLGTFIGPGKSPYEVWSYGVVIWESKNTSLLNMDIHDIAADGIMIKNFTDEGLNTANYNTVLRNLKILKSGRNNISWIGGNGFTLENSTLGLASQGIVKTDPGASLDIEPELHVKKSDRCHSILVDGKYITINDYCINGKISNSYFYGDRLFSLLNADRTSHVKNITINDSRIVNTEAKVYWSVKENTIDFNKCTLIGQWLINGKQQSPVTNDFRIKNSTFKLQ